MDWQTIGGIVLRHGATTAGGWLVAHGYLGADGVSGFAGAVMILGGIGLSWWNKRGHAFALAVMQEQAIYWEKIATRSPPAAKP